MNHIILFARFRQQDIPPPQSPAWAIRRVVSRMRMCVFMYCTSTPFSLPLEISFSSSNQELSVTHIPVAIVPCKLTWPSLPNLNDRQAWCRLGSSYGRRICKPRQAWRELSEAVAKILVFPSCIFFTPGPNSLYLSNQEKRVA